MATSSAIRFLAGKSNRTGTLYYPGTLRLNCVIKTGSSRPQGGVLAVTDDAIKLSVAALPSDARRGDRPAGANAPVVKLLSEVSLLSAFARLGAPVVRDV